MTFEKAIEKLTYARQNADEELDPDWCASLDMAIKALEQQPCEDCISRQAAIDTITHELSCGAVVDQCGLETAYDLIKDLPPAQPQRKMGHWIRNDRQGMQAAGILTYHCSECGREISGKYYGKITLLGEFPYCHCGAKMEEVNADGDSN